MYLLSKKISITIGKCQLIAAGKMDFKGGKAHMKVQAS